MPELTPKSTPQHVTPPLIDPATWEDHQGFRETLLMQFPERRNNAALRQLGRLLYDLVLSSGPSREDRPAESATHDPAIRPKRSRDPIKAAFQVFQEAIGEAPRTTPQPKTKAAPAGKPSLPKQERLK